MKNSVESRILLMPRNLAQLPPSQRPAFLELVRRVYEVPDDSTRAGLVAAVAEAAATAARDRRRQESSALYEKSARISVGARVPPSLYRRWKRAAGDESMYRFVITSCEREAARRGFPARWNALP